MAINSDNKRSMLEEFMIIQDSRCIYCNTVCFIGTIEQRINKDQYNNIATIEHLLPSKTENRNKKENLAMACNKCNNERSKGISKPPKKLKYEQKRSRR